MTRLEQIEQDVAGLSPDELARFRDWFDANAAERFAAVQLDLLRLSMHASALCKASPKSYPSARPPKRCHP